MSTPADQATILAKFEALVTRVETAVKSIESTGVAFYKNHVFYIGLIAGAAIGVIVQSIL